MYETHALRSNVVKVRDTLRNADRPLSMSDLVFLTELSRPTINKVLKVALRMENVNRLKRGRCYFYTWAKGPDGTRKMFEQAHRFCG